MASDNETRQTEEAVVSVRIPHGADDDLATDAEQRLSRVDGVTGVHVDELQRLGPGLLATVTTAISLTVYESSRV